MPTTTVNGETIRGEATYKGRKYALKYLGDTRHGRRAKLAFTDLSKEFWVDAKALESVDIFPVEVDANDYRPPKTNRHIPDESQLDPSCDPRYNDPPPKEELPSYCSHCGQLIA